MEKAYADGKARAIGVSNFQACRFYDFASVVDVKPAVNQLQCCVLSQQRTILPEMARLRKACDELELLVDKRMWPFPTYEELMFEI